MSQNAIKKLIFCKKNRIISATKISKKIGDSRNPAIIVDCGMHAREWVSFAFCLYLIDDLINGATKDWTRDIYWVVYPMLNPDGYHFR